MMPAGKYYVGDLCYVMHDKWDDVCDMIIPRGGKNVVLDGEFQLKDGTLFSIYSTAYGDGEYRDDEGRRYSVDAGSIGCILVDSISEDDKKNLYLGNIVEFTNSFRTCGDNGIIRIGNIVINTKDEIAYDEDDGQPDEAQEWADFDPDC